MIKGQTSLAQGILTALMLAAGLVVAQEPSRKEAAETNKPTSDHRAGVGKGIFTKYPGNLRRVPEHAKQNPLVTGIEAKIVWAELEPKKGQYAWNLIDEFLAECRQYGKQAAFKFWTVSGKVMNDGQLARGRGKAGADVVYQNTDTPAWLFDDPEVKRLGGIITPKGKLPYYPVFWDPAYQRHLEEFIAAFAKRYDGDPRLEYIRIGGWQILTNEPSFYGGASEFLVDQLLENGMDVRGMEKNLKKMRNLPGDSPYSKAVLQMMDIWFKHFRKTRLGVTVHEPQEKATFEDVQMQSALAHKALIMNTGLNEGDKTEMRRLYRTAHDQGCKVGWGDLTHVGEHLDRSKLAAKGHSLWMEIVQQAAGSDTDRAYRPAARISYLILNAEGLEDPQAAKWIVEHLTE
jgi:hypothetical protein